MILYNWSTEDTPSVRHKVFSALINNVTCCVSTIQLCVCHSGMFETLTKHENTQNLVGFSQRFQTQWQTLAWLCAWVCYLIESSLRCNLVNQNRQNLRSKKWLRYFNLPGASRPGINNHIFIGCCQKCVVFNLEAYWFKLYQNAHVTDSNK